MANDPKPPTTITVSATSLAAGRRTGDDPVDNVPVRVDGHTFVLKVLQPITIISVRALRVFIQTLLGTLPTAGGVKAVGLVPAVDFGHLLLIGASFSVATTGVCILQNILELATKFDQSHPNLAG